MTIYGMKAKTKTKKKKKGKSRVGERPLDEFVRPRVQAKREHLETFKVLLPEGRGLHCIVYAIPGYLGHKKHHPPRTLQKDYTWGPMVVPGRGGGFL